MKSDAFLKQKKNTGLSFKHLKINIEIIFQYGFETD